MQHPTAPHSSSVRSGPTWRRACSPGAVAPRRLQPAAPAAPRLAASRRQQQQEQQQQQQQEEEAAVVDVGAPRSNLFSDAVNRLLRRAATSLTRGPAHCLTCKGQGSCTCPMCKGAGLTDPQHSKPNAVRHAAQKMRQVLNVDRSEYHTDQLITNRCRRCHGTGAVVCPTCSGMGVRQSKEPATTPPQ